MYTHIADAKRQAQIRQSTVACACRNSCIWPGRVGWHVDVNCALVCCVCVCVWASILPFTHDHLLHTHTHAHMHRKVCTDKFGAGAKKTQFYESAFSHSYRRKFSHASARPETPPLLPQTSGSGSRFESNLLCTHSDSDSGGRGGRGSRGSGGNGCGNHCINLRIKLLPISVCISQWFECI